MNDKNNISSENFLNFPSQNSNAIFFCLLLLAGFQLFLTYRIFGIFSALVRNGTISGLPFILDILGNLSLYAAVILVFIKTKLGKFFFGSATVLLAGTFLTQRLVFDSLSYPVIFGCFLGYAGWWISRYSITKSQERGKTKLGPDNSVLLD